MVVEYLLILGRQKAATRCRWRIELHSYTSIYHNLYQFNIIFHNLSIFWPVLDGLCVMFVWIHLSILEFHSFRVWTIGNTTDPWFWHLDVCVKVFGCCAWAPRQHGDMVLAAQCSRNDPRSKRRLVIIPYNCLIHSYWIHIIIIYIYIYPFISLLRIWNGWNILFYFPSMSSADHPTTQLASKRSHHLVRFKNIVKQFT